MSQMIETMEPRTLLSASPAVIAQDINVLGTAGTQSKADLTASLNLAKADAKQLKATVTAAHPTAAQKKVLNTFLKDEKSAAAKYKQSASKILASGTRDGTRLIALLKNLRAHPDNAATQAKVQTELAALQNVFSTTAVTTFETSANTTVTSLDADLNAVAVAVPSSQTDANTIQNHFSLDLGTLSSQATAIQSAISQLSADLA